MATQHAAYDLVLKGGTLMDAAQNINDRRDVAFKDGKVAAVYQRIDPTLATEVVDVTGKLVTPRFHRPSRPLLRGRNHRRGGVASDADATCLPAGVTTAVDAGTAAGQLQDHARFHSPHKAYSGSGLPPYRGYWAAASRSCGRRASEI